MRLRPHELLLAALVVGLLWFASASKRSQALAQQPPANAIAGVR
ncbi:MAG: hypothetical protein AAF682_15750 [Planctomycetota bacterium]